MDKMVSKAAPLSATHAAEGWEEKIGQMRHRDFLVACRRVVEELSDRSGKLRISDVAEKAAARPAPQYYVSFEYALRMMYRLNAKGTSGVRGPMENCWQEIAARVREQVEKSHGRLSIKDALSRVLASGHASSFFLSPSTARRLYHHAMRNRRK